MATAPPIPRSDTAVKPAENQRVSPVTHCCERRNWLLLRRSPTVVSWCRPQQSALGLLPATTVGDDGNPNAPRRALQRSPYGAARTARIECDRQPRLFATVPS